MPPSCTLLASTSMTGLAAVSLRCACTVWHIVPTPAAHRRCVQSVAPVEQLRRCVTHQHFERLAGCGHDMRSEDRERCASQAVHVSLQSRPRTCTELAGLRAVDICGHSFSHSSFALSLVECDVRSSPW